MDSIWSFKLQAGLDFLVHQVPKELRTAIHYNIILSSAAHRNDEALFERCLELQMGAGVPRDEESLACSLRFEV